MAAVLSVYSLVGSCWLNPKLASSPRSQIIFFAASTMASSSSDAGEVAIVPFLTLRAKIVPLTRFKKHA